LATDKLNLRDTLRPGLDLLANEILIAFKKRTRFPRNAEIYEPGLVVGHPEAALLDFELARTERFHAELGRYAYTRYDSFSDVGDVPLIIKRPPPESPAHNFPTQMGARIRDYYVEWVRANCRPGSDSDTWGETVSADVAILMNLAERVTLGKTVAESKFQNEREAFLGTGGDATLIEALIVNKPREEQVIELSRRLARLYEFEEEFAASIFRWIIRTTIEVEIHYLRERMRDERGA
jgi:chorismate mutase